MTSQAELISDLRFIIATDVAAQVKIIYGGREIAGTKGDLTKTGSFDRDGGGIQADGALTATFVFGDFPNMPDGTELVPVNGVTWRIHSAKVDDFSAALVLEFVGITDG